MSLHLCSVLLVFLTQWRFIERVRVSHMLSEGFTSAHLLSSLPVPFCARACSWNC